MPELIADALACVGENLTDWLDLLPLDPAYRTTFADGSTIDVHTDAEAMAQEIAAKCSAKDVAGYRRFVNYLGRLYELERRRFIDRNIDSPLSLVHPDAARLFALGGLRRLTPKVAQFLTDDRLQRIFSFQAMYAGLAPQDALAIYAVISYMDTVTGVTFPRGGMHEVPLALAGAAAKHGVTFRYGTTAKQIEVSNDRATAVITTDGRTPHRRRDHRQRRPAGGLPRTAARALHAAPGALAHLLALLLPDARRRRSWFWSRRAVAGAPQHLLRSRVATHVRRDHQGRPVDERPVLPDQQPQPERPEPGAGRPTDLLRALPHPQPRLRPGLVDARPALPRRGAGHAGRPRIHRHQRRRSRSSSASPRPTGVRPGWRPAPRSRPRTRSPSRGRSGHRPSTGGSAIWCSAGRTPSRESACRWCCCRDAWRPNGSPVRGREPAVGTRTGRGRHLRRAAAGFLRRVPRAQLGARQDLLPRHPVAAAEQTAGRPRAVRVRPLGR